MKTTYPMEAQVHSLSLISNAAFDLQEPDAATLQRLTTTIITDVLRDPDTVGYIGQWDLIWGPVVYSNNPDAARVVADNTLMLVYNKAENQFTVAIAGTNAVSMYGWFQEDFGVNTLVEWETIVHKKTDSLFSKPSIAAGTHRGLQVLLQMQSGNVTMLQALDQYIKSQGISGATVAVGGHSLGGALTPVMAMYMQDTLAGWNTAGGITSITAWPTAGPTPGNAAFAAYVEKHMGKNYISRYNTIDVIPQAWMYSSFEHIPVIYPEISAPEHQAPYYSTIGLLVLAANLRTVDLSALFKRIDYQQVQPWNALQGTFDKLTNDKAIIEADVVNLYATGNLAQYRPYFRTLFQFLMQMGYQHTKAYNDLLHISEVAAVFRDIKKKITGTTEEDRMMKALHTALEKLLGMGQLSGLATAPVAAV